MLAALIYTCFTTTTTYKLQVTLENEERALFLPGESIDLLAELCRRERNIAFGRVLLLCLLH